jgi:uncharacterized membrane protein YoaK (UPF0700 family)
MLGVAKIAVAVGLAFVAAYVDALSWLSLDRVFAGQMSGNVVLLGVHLAAGAGEHAWLQGEAVGAFFLGLIVSGAAIEIGLRRRKARILTVAIAIELALLIVFALAVGQFGLAAGSEQPHPGSPIYVLAGVVALAMGVQNTSLRMAGILSAFTTHITGTLTQFGEQIIVCGFALLQRRDPSRAPVGFASAPLQEHGQPFRMLIQSALLLLGFFAGALGGASLSRAAGVGAAMLVPIALLILAGIFDWLVPLIEFHRVAER